MLHGTRGGCRSDPSAGEIANMPKNGTSAPPAKQARSYPALGAITPRRRSSFHGDQECLGDLPVKGRENYAAGCCELNQMAVGCLSCRLDPIREM